MKTNIRERFLAWCPQPEASAPTILTGISQYLKRSRLLYAIPIILLITVITLAAYFFSRPPIPWGIPPMRFEQPYKITNLDWDETTGQIRFLVKNTDDEPVTLSEVYVNDTVDPEAVVDPHVLSPNQTAEVTLSETYVKKPTVISVRVVTSDGPDAYFTKNFFAVELEDVDWDESTGRIKFLVRNTGDETVTLSEVYANGTLDDTATINSTVLLSDQVAEVTLSGTFRDTHTYIPIRVTTLEGASDEDSSPIFGIWIGSIGWDDETGRVWALVNSNGYEDVTLSGVYVNGTLDAAAKITGSPSVYTVTLSETYLDKPLQLTFKVVTEDGAFAEMAYPMIRIRIEEIDWDNNTGQIKVLVQDMSAKGVTFDDVYVNGTLDATATIARAPPRARMYEVTLSETYSNRPSQITVKVTTLEGSFDEKQKTFAG